MPTLETTRATALLAAILATLAGPSACSLVVESQDHQCTEDADCSGFDDAVCNVKDGVCVPRETATTGVGGGTSGSTTTTSSTASGAGGADCAGPDGCYSCEPTAQPEFLNACTDAACIPFDNGQLDGLLEEDGSLPPVP